MNSSVFIHIKMWLGIARDYSTRLQHYFILKIILIYDEETHETFYMTENCDNHNWTLTEVKTHLAVAT